MSRYSGYVEILETAGTTIMHRRPGLAWGKVQRGAYVP